MQRAVGSGLLLVLLSQTALAADLPAASRPDRVTPDLTLPPPVTWSGAYGGLFAGYGALDSTTQFVCTGRTGGPGLGCPVLPSRQASDDGFIAGGEVGYTWQAPAGLVAGAAADHQFTRLWGYGRQAGDFPTLSGVTFEDGVTHSGQRLDDLATFRGKLGIAFDRTLVYATAGLARGNVRIDNNLSVPGVTVFDGRGGAVRLGYVAGGGVEYALSAHLSAKVEGLYYDLGARTVLPEQMAGLLPGYRAGTRVTTEGFLTRVGLNYRFGAGLPELPPEGPAGSATWAFEGGLRYGYSAGRFGKTLNDAVRPEQVNSRLIYDGTEAQAGETFARLDHAPTGLFAKGFLGTGGVTRGRLSDEDIPPVVRPYSKTLHPVKDGDIGYGVIDFGTTLLHRDGFRLGGFVGYQYNSELLNGYGCHQVAGGNICARDPSPDTVKGLGENGQWSALRLGLIGEARFGRIRLSLEGAYLPVAALDGVDRHWLRPNINPGPEWGRGDGYFLEGIVSYDLTPALGIGIGGRSWRMQANKGATTAFAFEASYPMKFETARYGGFVQLSYRVADFGLGEAGAATTLVRKD